MGNQPSSLISSSCTLLLCSSKFDLQRFLRNPRTRTTKMVEMKKAVLKLDVHDEKSKQKAMKIVSGLIGVESVAMDMKDKKLTVMGDIDAVTIVCKLRKVCHTSILSVGPAKEPEKKKEEPKKEEPKKEDPKKAEEDKKKAEQKKKEELEALVKAYQNYNPHMTTHYYVRSMEEDPNACVIC